MGKKVNITDIAREMGVTPSTVSRALSGSPRVKESTRLAVEQKARELGYERNIMASNLRKGVTKAVGVIVPRINRQFFSNIISSAESVLREAGYTVIVCQSLEELAFEMNALKTLSENRVSGIFTSHSIESLDGSHIMDLVGEGIKLVQYDRVFSELPGIKIVNNNEKGGYEATMCLIRNGYKRIGVITGHLTTSIFKERYAGYRRALMESGMALDEDIVFDQALLRDNGYVKGKEALAKGCDAVYCTGDYTSLGVMHAVLEAGLRIPEDFGIVGTANEDFTALTTPDISTLEQNPKLIGRKAAEAFLSSDEDDEYTVVVPMELIERTSSDRNKN